MAAMLPPSLHPFFPHLAEEHGLFFGPTGDEVRQGALQSLGFPTAPGAVGDGYPGWWGETWCFTSLKPPIQEKPLVDVATKVPK